MNVADYLSKAARIRPEGAAVRDVQGSLRLSFRELDAKADALAAGLMAAGLQRGDRVADLHWNHPEVLVVDFALARAGFVRVPLNVRSHVEEIASLMRRVGVRALVVGEGVDDECLDGVLGHYADLDVIVTSQDGGPGWTTAEVLSRGTHYLTKIGNLRTQPSDADMLLSIKFTGGSTGQPKAVGRTHRQQVSVARNILMDLFNFNETDRLFQVQPMSHGAGAFVLPCIMRLTEQVTIERFVPEVVVAALILEKITVIKLVPTILYRILDEIGGAEFPSHLRGIISGAAPMNPDRVRKTLEKFGPILRQTYGQTEFPVTISTLGAEDHAQAVQKNNQQLIMSAGLPYTCVDVRVVDRDGLVVPLGATGEIQVKGDIVGQRIDALVAKTDPVPLVEPPEWLGTGDLGKLSADGYLSIVDRMSDMIVSGGFNVYPAEVESTIGSHPAVAGVAVVGVDHADWGQQVAALVALKPDQFVDEEGIVAYCSSRISRYKVPKVVVIADELPITSAAKVSRREARDIVLKVLAHNVTDAAASLHDS